MSEKTVRLAVAVLAITAISACGGGKSNSTQSNRMTTNASMPETHRESNALPNRGAAPIPSSVRCGAVKPVWVNLKSGAYHEPSDPYYGRTRNGKYLCPSDAAAQGYHPAGSMRSHHRRSKSRMNRPQASPQASPSQ
jgi:hypothetical protein